MNDSPKGYVAPPSTCVTLEAVVVRNGGTFVATDEPQTVHYALPPHATRELREFFGPHATASFPAAGVARLPGARVFGTGTVLSADGDAIARDVSLDFGKPFEEHWLRQFAKIRPPQAIAGTTAVIATTLGHGYSHWLLEELPRLLALPRDGIDTLLAHHAGAFARDALQRRRINGRVIQPRRHDHYTCAELVVPTLGWPAPSTLAAIRDFGASSGEAERGRGERLYISRDRARRRRVTNEAELWAQLEPRGFVRVVLEEMTWAAQCAAFAAARVVVSPHGAGLANLVFCEPGTRVVEFFDRRYVNGCYWKIAALRELDYRPVVPAGSFPLAQELSANRDDLTADVAQIIAAAESP